MVRVARPASIVVLAPVGAHHARGSGVSILQHREAVRLGLAALCYLAASRPAASADEGRPTPSWLHPPRLAIMTGFIKDPSAPGDIREWAQGLGAEFDAAAWVRAFVEADASYVIFYDKWIDGLVFHDTATTSFRTPRDFLREMADACHAAGLPLVIYWNAAYDDNPEFAEYVTRDAEGRPITFPSPWVCRLLSMHSPFREKAQEQVREILRDYGPIGGLWLDCYGQPWPTTDRYTEQAFRERYGVSPRPPGQAWRPAPPEASGSAGRQTRGPQEATPAQGWAFVQETLVAYLRELHGIAAELQPDLCLTTNGSGLSPLESPLWAADIGAQLQFLSAEGHSLPAMDQQALAAGTVSRPLETGDLISATWFSPTLPMGPGRGRRALAEAAVAWCQGANVYMALSPDYKGRFGPELEAVRAAGAWLCDRRELLAASEPWPDVGVILGAPSPSLSGYPSLGQLWGRPVREVGAWAEASGLLRRLNDLGYGGRVLLELGDFARWPEPLARFRALVVPERASLGPEHLERLRRYVTEGGTLLVFGNGSGVAPDGTVRADLPLADLLGLRYGGPVEFAAGEGPVVCYADSEYGQGWVKENLVDGTAAGWASADSAMPHWAQVNLPVEQPIAKVRVIGRDGGYLLRDFEVLTWNGTGWDLAQRYQGNTERTVECLLEPPRTTLGVRVLVQAETLLGQERNLADIEEIELIGLDGRVLSPAQPFALAVQFAPSARTAPEAIRLRSGRAGAATSPGQGSSGSVAGPAVAAEATSAEVLATFRDPLTDEARPLITVHHVGRGRAAWVATGTGGPMEAAWLPRLLEAVVGAPTVRQLSGAGRYRVILRRAEAGMLMAVVDTQPDQPPGETRLRLDLGASGLRGEVAPLADAQSVEADRGPRRLTLRVRPDPAVVFVLE